MVGAQTLTAATGWSNTAWTTNYSTYASLIDTYISGNSIDIWSAGHVLQSKNDSVRFRLTGGDAQSEIFAFAYEMEAAGLVSLQVATDASVILDSKASTTCYESVGKMYVAIAVDGTVVWPTGATRADYTGWHSCTDVDELNKALADATIWADAGDLMLLSDDATQIARLKTVEPLLRCVYDAREQTSLSTIVANAATCGTVACLLSSSSATSENSAYLAERGMTVWYAAQSTDVTETVRLVTVGGNGILTTSRTAVEAVLTDATIFAPQSLHTPIAIVGHQGSTYWEYTQPNTIGAAKWAISVGASLVEMDVYLTKDGKTVVMHNDTLDGTTNGTGKVEEMTLAEIQQYKVTAHPKADPAEIPTLEDYLSTFKDYKTLSGTNVVLNIEIKSGKAALIPVIAQLIEEYKMADQCRIVCFTDSQIAEFHKACPTIPVVCISGTLDSLDTILKRTARAGAAYNPNYAKFDHDNLQKLSYRGVSTHMWTPDSDSDIYNTYSQGMSSLCLNWSNKITDIVTTLRTDATSYALTTGAGASLTLSATTYGGKEASTAAAEMVILSGNETLQYTGGTLTATATGEATVLFRMPITVGAQTLYIYTTPVTVQVG